MASSPAPAIDRTVSIGRILSRAFGTIGSNPIATLGIAFLFGALPSVALNYFVQRERFELLQLLGMGGAIALALGGAAIGIVFAIITQGALVRATVAYSEGRRAGILESMAAGLVVALPLIGLAILSALGTAAGLILLIVPGIILYIMWSVAAPALVEEKLGPIEALGRSRRLTDGARWSIFGLEALLVVSSWILSALLGVIMYMIYGGLPGVAVAAQEFALGYAALAAGMQTLTSVLWGTVHTSLYVELREWKDGPAAETLAAVFG